MIIVTQKREVLGYIVVYAGRGSPLGNPFRMYDESERDAVCDKYARYFEQEVRVHGPLRAEVARLWRMHKEGKNIALRCFCAPRRCHCDTVKAFIEAR